MGQLVLHSETHSYLTTDIYTSAFSMLTYTPSKDELVRIGIRLSSLTAGAANFIVSFCTPVNARTITTYAKSCTTLFDYKVLEELYNLESGVDYVWKIQSSVAGDTSVGIEADILNVNVADTNPTTVGGTTPPTLDDMYAKFITDAHLDHLIPVAGTVSDGSPSATEFDTDLTEASDGHYNNSMLMFTSGNLANQARPINGYTGLGGNCAFSTAFAEAPANGDAFILIPAFYMADVILHTLGLDVISTTEPTGDSSTWSFQDWLNWLVRRFANKAVLTLPPGGAGTLKVRNDADDDDLSSQDANETGTNQLILGEVE